MQPVSKAIDGFTFTLSPFPVMTALELMPQVTGLFAPALDKLRAGEAADSIGPIVASVMRTDPKKLVEVTRLLLASCVVRTPDGRESLLMPQADVLLAGKTLLKVAAFSVEVNYADFFDEVRKLLAKLGANGKVAAFRSKLETMLSGSGPSSASSGPAGSPGPS